MLMFTPYTSASRRVKGWLTSKTGYHHGDLRAALIDAGLALTRTGGPEALTIREATRRVGVSPNAAYRHFADREALLRRGCDGDPAPDGGADAELGAPTRLTSCRRAIGCERSGLATSNSRSTSRAGSRWHSSEPVADEPNETASAPPYLALVEALDAMVDAGVLTPERRDGAEWPCWSAVHGFAELALRGPLRMRERRDVEALARRTVDDIIAGVTAAR